MRCYATLLFAAVLLCVGGSNTALAGNPFGLMLWPVGGQDLDVTAARAAALGVAWFRPPAVFIDRWAEQAPCPTCGRLAQSGLKLALTVRNGGHDGQSGRPATPPADLDAYRKTLASILDAWKPALLTVENEENLPAFYSDGSSPGRWDSTTAAAYGHELEAACAVAHARSVLCTNGGLSGQAAAGLAWLNLLEQGRPQMACDFARRAFYSRRSPDAGSALCAYQRAADLPAAQRAALLQNADMLLPIYRAAPIDAVNFHWYGHDAAALATTAQILERLTGKPAMSNEIGQRPWDAAPSRVRPLLRAAYAAGLKVAIWFSIDTPAAVSLFDESGRLRASGQEFARQMSGRK